MRFIYYQFLDFGAIFKSFNEVEILCFWPCKRALGIEQTVLSQLLIPPAQKYADSFYHTRRKIIINIYIEDFESKFYSIIYYIKNEKLQ